MQTFHRSIGKQLVAKDPAASQVSGEIITFKEIKSFPIVVSFFPRLSFYHLPSFSNEMILHNGALVKLAAPDTSNRPLPTSILSMANKISTSMSNSSSTIPLPSKSPKSPIDSSPASQENISYHTPLCSHSPHCVIRQPHPPPPDKCSVMQHSGSLYHEHMVSEMGVPSRYNTHEYCMRIEYQNYGCDNCIWFKWWGELHGYPDINPWSFREHLEPVTHL